MAASITPPVVPKIWPAPVAIPRGESKSSSSNVEISILFFFNKQAISLTVITLSTAFIPFSKSKFSRFISAFLAEHGIRATEYIFSFGIFIFSA
ncbi:unknown [Clostridium sp. CAG:1219]|nr:unknown [Clostridium sp. CAG:1219]